MSHSRERKEITSSYVMKFSLQANVGVIGDEEQQHRSKIQSICSQNTRLSPFIHHALSDIGIIRKAVIINGIRRTSLLVRSRGLEETGSSMSPALSAELTAFPWEPGLLSLLVYAFLVLGLVSILLFSGKLARGKEDGSRKIETLRKRDHPHRNRKIPISSTLSISSPHSFSSLMWKPFSFFPGLSHSIASDGWVGSRYLSSLSCC